MAYIYRYHGVPTDELPQGEVLFTVGVFGEWYKDCVSMQEAAEVFYERFGKKLTDQEIAAYEQGFLFISCCWDLPGQPVCDLIEPVEMWRGLLAYTTPAKTAEFFAKHKRFRELFPEIKLPEWTERQIEALRKKSRDWLKG